MLPPLFIITPEMLRLISELEESKGQWRQIRSLSPEKLISLQRVTTIESVGSSTRIEGSELTDRQVEDLLARLDITEFRTRDEQEVVGYAYVMDQVFRCPQADSGHGEHNRSTPSGARKIDLEASRATDLHPLARKIVALLPDQETLTLRQLVQLTGGKPSTLKIRLRELVGKGYLISKGQGRGAHYVRA